jgi:uncharacterized membrane protein
MSSVPVQRKASAFLLITAILSLAVTITVLLDVPVARQVIGFLYFSFFPGFIVVKLLRIEALSKLETVLFSAGLSIALLMLSGLLVNEFGFLLGISAPLSTLSLIVALNLFILAGAIAIYSRTKYYPVLDLKLKYFQVMVLLLLLPVFSIIGAMAVNIYGNNIILLALLVAISILFIIIAISKSTFTPKLYPIAILAIVVSLVFSSSLISNNLVSFGSDIQSENFVIQTTLENNYWNHSNSFYGDQRIQRLNAMLSVTVFPTIYSNILNIDSTWVLKIIFPLILSLVPLALYYFWQTRVSKKYAFIAAFLFIAESTFYTEVLGLARQIVAELFFVLLLIVIFSKKMRPFVKVVCFAVFSFALITSHYGVSEVFLFFLFISLIALFVTKKPRVNITIFMLLSFMVIMFSWYIFTSLASTYNSIVEFVNYVISQQIDFLNPASRGSTVLLGLGLGSSSTIWNLISRVFAYATEALIIVGFLGLITKRIKTKIEKDYLILIYIATAMLAALIIIPGLANTMNMSRFYHLLLFFLAPVFVLGGEVLVKFLLKRRKELIFSVLLTGILVPYFLFQTGFVYEVVQNDNWSLPLSGYRMDPYRLYRSIGVIYDQDVFSNSWIDKNVNFGNRQFYADRSSLSILLGQGIILPNGVTDLNNATEVSASGIVYLNWLNVANGTIAGYDDIWNTTEVYSLFNDMNKIYSNGASEVYGGRVP